MDSVGAAERILDKSGAKIEEIEQNQSYYVPALDKIVLPLRTQFKDAEGFYATALHELGHWTGHSSRLNRPILNKFRQHRIMQEKNFGLKYLQ